MTGPAERTGSPLQDRIERARAEGRSALIAYLPVGYPSVEGSIEAMRAAVDGGADIIEVGVPYSDPGMDGPVIQRAVEPAVRAGVGMADVLAAVSAVAATGAVPTVMTYWNPIERYGVARFARDLAAAGGAGAITPDLIPDEAQEWLPATDEHGLDRIFLVAPSSTPARIESTARACRGFVYAASTMGVTGTRTAVSTVAPELVSRVRAVSSIPVGVGLGVSNGDQAAEVAAYADAVIVGSAFVACLVDAADEPAGREAVRALAADLARGVRQP